MKINFHRFFLKYRIGVRKGLDLRCSKRLQMDTDVYVTVTHRFLKRKMVEDAMDLFWIMAGRPEKLSIEDFVFLLKKVVVTGDLDLKFVTRVMRYYQNAGNEVKALAFNAVLKLLRSVGKLGGVAEF